MIPSQGYFFINYIILILYVSYLGAILYTWFFDYDKTVFFNHGDNKLFGKGVSWHITVILVLTILIGLLSTDEPLNKMNADEARQTYNTPYVPVNAIPVAKSTKYTDRILLEAHKQND